MMAVGDGAKKTGQTVCAVFAPAWSRYTTRQFAGPCGAAIGEFSMTPEKQSAPAKAPADRPPVRLVLFPIARRRKFIQRIALAMKRKPSNKAANEYLALQMTIQAKAMRQKGMDLGLIRKQLHGLEVAVRTELWRLILGSPSSDGDDAT
jgi:hypothetical protein